LFRTHEGKTTYELWIGQKLSIGYFKVFGCTSYAFVPKELRKKLDANSMKTLFVGYSATSKAYRLWHLIKNHIIVCRDVLLVRMKILQ
jgi:hypothetical protein